MKKLKIEENIKKILRQFWCYDRKYLRAIERNYLKIRNFKFRNESEKRKRNTIFNYKVLAREMGLYTQEYYFFNSLYGTIENLRKYSNCWSDFIGAIEHGLYFGDYFNKEECDESTKNIITFSNIRENILKDKTKNTIFKIGPYIAYADSLYSTEEIKKLRKELGKVFLFFPSHSIYEVEAKYEINEILVELNKLKLEYNNILICMYYNDILNGKAKIYEENGYKIVTAGHKYDKYFLNRLKSIILLADNTGGNEIGTHVGYCIYLDKPYHLIGNTTYYFKNKDYKKEYYKIVKKSNERDKEKIKKFFLKKVDKITKEQKDICNKFWGFDFVKNKKEIEKILKNTEFINFK